jgi:cobalt/nickel transport system permease protein
MQLEPLEARSEGFSPLHRIDGRFKLLFALFYVIAVIATPAGWWRTLGVLALLLVFLIGLCGISPRWLLLRWLGFLALVGMLAAVAAPGLAARSGVGLVTACLSLLAKNSLAFVMMLILTAVTSWHDLLLAMRRLHVPRVLVATLQLMERYVHVLGEELGRMRTARLARSFHRRTDWLWSLLTSMISVLLLRSLERSERVHAAMTARGWDGTMRSLDD